MNKILLLLALAITGVHGAERRGPRRAGATTPGPADLVTLYRAELKLLGFNSYTP